MEKERKVEKKVAVKKNKDFRIQIFGNGYAADKFGNE